MVLIIDPLTNATDTTTLAGLGSASVYKWWGIEYAPNSHKMYAAPSYASAVLVIDPLANSTGLLALCWTFGLLPFVACFVLNA